MAEEDTLSHYLLLFNVLKTDTVLMILTLARSSIAETTVLLPL